MFSNLIKARPIVNKLLTIDHKHYFRFIMDGALLDQGETWLDYDARNPGDIGALFEAYAFVLSKEFLMRPLSLEIITKIQNKCAENNPVNDVDKIRENMPTGYALALGFSASIDGLLEVMEEIRTNGKTSGMCLGFRESCTIHNIPLNQYKKTFNDVAKSDNAITFENIAKDRQGKLKQIEMLHLPKNTLELEKLKDKHPFYLAPTPAFAKKELCRRITEFNGKSKNFNPKNYSYIIKTIASFANKVVRLHLYHDCNIRTAMALIFGLSIKYGILPPMLYEPWRFGLHTDNECNREILNGIETTKYLINTGNIRYFYDKKSTHITSRRIMENYDSVFIHYRIKKTQANADAAAYYLSCFSEEQKKKGISFFILDPFVKALEALKSQAKTLNLQAKTLNLQATKPVTRASLCYRKKIPYFIRHGFF